MRNQQSLFRLQAITSKTNALNGEPSLAGPPSIRLLALIAAAAALALVAILVFGSYARKETVAGFITTTEANVRVYPPVSGTIAAIYVAEGDSVTQGAPLARISTSTINLGDQSVQLRLLQSMREESAVLRNRIAGAQEMGENKNRALRRQTDHVLYQIGVLKKQRENAVERYELAMKNDRRLAEVRQAGLISELDVDNSRARLLDLKLTMNNLDRELATQRNILEQTRLEQLQLPLTNASTTGELETLLKQLEQRIADVQAQDAITIVAPIDGRVADLGRRVGQQVSANTPIVSVLPNDASYSAELYVPSRSVGFIREGTEVQIRYDAFPHQKFGVFGGTVVKIGASPIRPHEADAAIPIIEPSYLLTVRLDDQTIFAEGRRRPLTAGMTLQADIVQSHRRIIEWVFDPLLSAVKRTQ